MIRFNSTKNATAAPSNSSKELSYCLAAFNTSAKDAPTDPAVAAWQYLSGICTSVGAVINLLVLIIVLQSPQLRKGAGVFIAHLLVCHLALCSVVIPIVTYRVGRVASLDPKDCSFCRYQHFWHTTLNTLVNWSEGLLALNRLIAIFFPTKFYLFNRRSVQFPVLTVCWILTLTYTLPPAFSYLGIYKMNPAFGTCTMANKNKDMAIILSFNSYCPLTLITVAAAVIIGKTALTLRPGARNILVVPSNMNVASEAVAAVLAAPASASSAERRKRISTMLMMSFTLGITCQLPQNIMSLTGYSAGHPSVVLWFWLLSVVQFAATPMIFLTMNKDYQTAAGQLFARIRGLKVPGPRRSKEENGSTRPRTQN